MPREAASRAATARRPDRWPPKPPVGPLFAGGDHGIVCQTRAVPTVEPELWVGSPSAAIAFYEKAFGAVVLHQVGANDDIVARLEVDGARFWVSNAGGARLDPLAAAGTTSRTLLVVGDPDALVGAAVEAGAELAGPVSDEHGWRLGRIVDPFGQEWEVGHPLHAD